jgi:hypothetical protein
MRLCCYLFLGSVLITVAAYSQEDNFIAIVPPFMDRFHDNEWGSPLQLTNQRFVLFLYRNAAIVYSEADFNNTSSDSQTAELSLPSTGYVEKDVFGEPYQSNGILSVQCWVAGERSIPTVVDDGDNEMITLNVAFPPTINTKVKALFWVQTSLTDIDSLPGLDTLKIQDGKRGLIIDLSKAAVWKGVIGSADVQIVFKEGLSPHDTITVDPDFYDTGDSTITWTFTNIEPSTDDNISIFYDSARKNKTKFDTMKKLSRFIVKREYDRALEYVRQPDED